MTSTESRRPFILPLIRVALAFTVVFLLAGFICLLFRVEPLAIALTLAVGVAHILAVVLVTPRRISARYHGTEAHRGQFPRLELAADDLSSLFRVPKPRLLIVPSTRPNAMSFGFGTHTYIGVTEGLLATLDDARLRAVLAHEYAHIRNRDCVTQSLGLAVKASLILISVVLSAIFIVAGILIVALVSSLLRVKSMRAERGMLTLSTITALGFLLLSPLTISVSYFFFSRRTEFRADAHSAATTGRPKDLADALREIDKATRTVSSAVTNGAYSSLWIVSRDDDDLIGRLLSSHPPVEERIRRLMEMHDRLGGGMVE